MKILIADSNPEKLNLYKRILEGDNHEILTAKDRLGVSIAYKRHKIDVVVLDLKMPDNIERLVQLYGTPIVAISGSKEKELEAFSKTNFAIRRYNEDTLKYAVRVVGNLELAVA